MNLKKSSSVKKNQIIYHFKTTTMKIELLQNPLSKGEKWEGKHRREVEITKSGDNRGMKPNVYFSINIPRWPGKSPVPKKCQMEIGEDLFIPTEVAILIGKQLIKEARAIDKEHKKRLVKKYTEARAKMKATKGAKKRYFVKAKPTNFVKAKPTTKKKKSDFPKPTEMIDKW